MWSVLFKSSKFYISLALWLVLTPVYAETETEIRLIAHDSLKHEKVEVSVARAIFTGKLTRWSNGQRIHVFVLQDNHAYHRLFVKKQLGLFPYQLRQIWDRNVFSGLGEAPDVVANIQEMCHLVATTPGAVGYAPVEECLAQGVRYVTMD